MKKKIVLGYSVLALVFLVCLQHGASAEGGMVPGGGASSTLKASPHGKALCPFVVKSGSSTKATIDCIGGASFNASVTVNGNITAAGLNAATAFNTSTLNPFTVKGSVTDSTTAVSTSIDSTNALSTTGAKILSIRNATVEKAYVDKDGKAAFAGLTMQALGQALQLDPGGTQPISGSAGGISVGSNLLPSSSGTKGLGSASNRWGTTYVTGIDVGSQKVTNIANGASSTDAAALGQLRPYSLWSAACLSSTVAATKKCGDTGMSASGGQVSELDFAIDTPGTGASGYTVSLYDATTSTNLCASISKSCTEAGPIFTSCTGATFSKGDELWLVLHDATCTTGPTGNITAQIEWN